MRILEKCTSSWPMPNMQQQIDALREAFSADTRKPFVLKPSFPYGSPGAPSSTSPPRANPQYRSIGAHGQPIENQNVEHQHAQPHQQVSYTNHPISPPISAGGVTDTKSDSPAAQSLVMMAAQRGPQPQQPMTSGVPMADSNNWNPTRLFEYVLNPIHAFSQANYFLAHGTRPLVRLLRMLQLLHSKPL